MSKSNVMPKRGSVFQTVKGLHPSYSVFDLSYVKTMTLDMGQLIPVACEEVVPGDIFKIGNQMVLRFQPMLAPILHEVNVYVHYFFVPYRILWDPWEAFITGGSDGQNTTPLPQWGPSAKDIGSLWDYLGYPTGVAIPSANQPMAFPKMAYAKIYNEYYRDETLQAEADLYQGNILNRNWEKDYFTSALPWQQRGIAPALPISGTTSAVWQANNFLYDVTDTTNVPPMGFANALAGHEAHFKTTQGQSAANARSFMNDNVVDLSSATTFNVADLRLAFQIQKFMERNARAGVRYTEFLRSHFGVSPRDDRLQRPEYIGGSKAPVIVSEVLQTASTDATSPQGNMAGHGISVNSSFCGKYRATEFGLIMGMLSVMPRSMYQQGIDRSWTRKTRYDFYFPEFANLSEQAITNLELYATADQATNDTIFGYQGRFDEMRTKRNMVCGQMRELFDYWHLGRKFSSSPTLSSSFIECNSTTQDLKRIFAVENEPGIICQFANLIKAWRPMPIQSNPGFIDHN